jgi:hypothetical protein
MSLATMARTVAAVLVAAGAFAAPAAAGGIGGSVITRPPIVERPEIRSYQPYSGLQFGFRPEPPRQRRIGEERPAVVMPEAVPPLIEYGAEQPYAAQYYRYCSRTRSCP